MKNIKSKSVFGERVAATVAKRRLAKKRRGFTLVEVIVVLVILAILAAIAIPALTGYIAKAQDKEWVAKARNVVVAYRSILDEAHIDGRLSSDKAVAYIQEGDQTDLSSGSLKIFSMYILARDAGNLGFVEEANALIGISSLPIHLYFVAPKGSTYTALDAPAFVGYKYLQGDAHPSLALTYGIDGFDGKQVKTWGDFYWLLRGNSLTCNPDSGYKVFHVEGTLSKSTP